MADVRVQRAPLSRPAEQSLSLNFALQRDQGFSLDVDLVLPVNGVTVLFGPSGSGKTTLLRLIAGLEHCSTGQVSLGSQVWQNEARFVPVHKRPLGYVFQEPSLLPHLSVRDNLRYACRRADSSAPGIGFDEAVDLFGIGHLLATPSPQLSGGEAQRVALARAMLTRPRLLLMDEPLSALDAKARQQVLPCIESLRSAHRIPIVYVTHSVSELARLADYLVLLKRGRVQASGAFAEVLAGPDAVSAGLEEMGTVIEGKVNRLDATWALAEIGFAGGSLLAPAAGLEIGRSVRLRILPDDVSIALSEQQDSSILNRLPGQIERVGDNAFDAQVQQAEQASDDQDPVIGTASVQISVRVGGQLVTARITRRSAALLKLRPGLAVWVQIKSLAILK